MPAWIHHTGHQSGVPLALTVRGARALPGMSTGVLARDRVELTQVCPDLAPLPEQLASARDAEDQLRLVRDALPAALRRRTPELPRAEVGPAHAALARGAPVAGTARAVGLSRRHLCTLVRAECGLGPKAFQRVARFESSRRLLRTGAVLLADVAVRTGYCPPSTWLREEGALAAPRAPGVRSWLRRRPRRRARRRPGRRTRSSRPTRARTPPPEQAVLCGGDLQVPTVRVGRHLGAQARQEWRRQRPSRVGQCPAWTATAPRRAGRRRPPKAGRSRDRTRPRRPGSSPRTRYGPAGGT